MKPRKCPNCKSDVPKYWLNPINKNMLVGRCQTCRKTVNLGKPGRDDQPAAPPSVNGTGKTEGQKKAPQKEAKKTGRSAKPAKPAGEPAAASASAAVRKPGGFGAKLRKFFEFD